MAALANQTSLNSDKSFFAKAGAGGNAEHPNILCSTLTAAVSVSAPTVFAQNVQNVQTINGAPYSINGVGNNIDGNTDLNLNPGYQGFNAYLNVASSAPNLSLNLDPNGGGVVGGRWLQTSVVPGSFAYRTDASVGGLGVSFNTVEVVQPSDTTSRLWFYAGNNGQGDLGTKWCKVAGTYTMELCPSGTVQTLAAGTLTFTTPQAYVAAPNLKYRMTVQGRIQYSTGTATPSDVCVLYCGFPINLPPSVAGTTVVLPNNLAQVPFTICGTISDPSNYNSINTIYATTVLGNNAVYDLYIDSFTVAQV